MPQLRKAATLYAIFLTLNMWQFVKTFLLTVIILGMISALGANIILENHQTTREFWFWSLFTFSWIIIPISICVILFYGIKLLYQKLNINRGIVVEIISLLILYLLGLLLLSLPEYYREKNKEGFTNQHFFTENLREAVFFATIFAITIPFMNKFLTKTSRGS